MAAHIMHVSGEMEPATTDAVDLLVEELDRTDDEHPDVSISDESGWKLSAFRDGLLVWENVEEDLPARHMTSVAREDARQHFRSLLAGDIAAVDALPWDNGYGSGS